MRNSRTAGFIVAALCAGCGNASPAWESSDNDASSPPISTSHADPVVAMLRLLNRDVGNAQFVRKSHGFQAQHVRGDVLVAWPSHANEAFRVADGRSPVAIEVRLREAGAAEAQAAGGLLLYRDALPGAHLLFGQVQDGTEDFVVYPREPETQRITYEVAPRASVAGLRLVADTLEFLDKDGTPRLRMAAPYLLDSTGTRFDAAVSVHGCAFDSDPRAPWGRDVVAPGAERCEVVIDWSEARPLYPAVLDPAWTTTGAMTVQRWHHQAVRLQNGRVLVAGGWIEQSTVHQSAELYDPTTSTFASTGKMVSRRAEHRASLLADGRVLLSGGINAMMTTLSTSEVYNPSTGSWTSGGAMNTARRGQTQTTLAGGEVLVTGGENAGPLSSAERYDPVTNTWTVAPAMTSVRAWQTATLLNDGRVLVAGGRNETSVVDTAELYARSPEGWSAAPPMNALRVDHSATLMADGKVMVAGGDGTAVVAKTEMFNPATNAWLASPDLNTPRRFHGASLLPDGRVLVSGTYFGGLLATAELFNPTQNAWSATASLKTARIHHTSTVLENGTVLVTGGRGATGTLSSAELFDVNYCQSAADCLSGNCADSYCCDTPCNGACDRCDLAGSKGKCTPVVDGTLGSPSCAPYLCDGFQGTCPSSCASSADCVTGNLCKSGVCIPKGSLGAICASNDECTSLNCVDNFCCNLPCSGPCDTCAAALGASADGFCTPITGPGTPTCAPYVCAGGTANCSTSCSIDADCASDAFCNSQGKCVLKLDNGASCTGVNQCMSGACVDGICCAGACDAPCDVCDAAGHLGECIVAPKGTSCGANACDGVSTSCPLGCSANADCSNTHYCVSGQCVPRLVNGFGCAGADECSSGHCVDGVCCDSDCLGPCTACSVSMGAVVNGTCQIVAGTGAPSCTPYVCGGNAAECPTSCAIDSQCASGFMCNGGECVPKALDGSACNTAEHCQSGFCVDGFCCDKECASPCDVCSATLGASMNGVCSPVNGAGMPACSPYVCDGVHGGCPTTCASDVNCATGYQCAESICVPAGSNGTACSTDNQCQSGHCVAGVCCKDDMSCGPSDGGSDAVADSQASLDGEVGAEAGLDAAAETGADGGEDAGSEGGALADAPSPDATAEAGTDAEPADAAPEAAPEKDSASVEDASAGWDALSEAATDGSTNPGDEVGPPEESGCGCRTAPARTPWSVGTLVAAAAVSLLSRRRRPRGKHLVASNPLATEATSLKSLPVLE